MLTIEELQELVDLTSAAVANLKYIDEHCPSTENLAQLKEETSEIAANLKIIEEND